MSEGGERGGARPPLIVYPTYYTFKAMGRAGADFRERIRQLVSGVVGPVDATSIVVRPSSAGKYEAVSVHVFLRNEDERRRVYEAFHGERAIVWYV